MGINTEVLIDSVDLVLIVLLLMMLTILIMRTSGPLDIALKVMFSGVCVLFVATLVRLNQYTGLVSSSSGHSALVVSRFVFLVIVTGGVLFLYRIISRRQQDL